MSPALCSFGGIHRRQLNSVLPAVGERVRTLELDRLARQQVDRCALVGDLVVRQVPMETERRDVLQEAQARRGRGRS